MRLAVVGGKLQGTEAAYLAGEAGYEVVLIDRRPGRPAAGLAGEVHVFDVTADPARTRRVLLSCDAVLPACEDDRALEFLTSFVPMMGLPLLFDLGAYAVTQSKLRSNALFERLDVPRPLPWPRCGFPVVVKPSVGSGSTGVQLVSSEPGLALARAALAAQGAQAVVEELVAGPSLSGEVSALGGEVLTLLPTFLDFDAAYDCKRVVAPVEGAGEAPVGGAAVHGAVGGVNSEPDHGSVFWFTVRLRKAPDLVVESANLTFSAQQAFTTDDKEVSLRVLLVEDNLVNQEVAKAMLESAAP